MQSEQFLQQGEIIVEVALEDPAAVRGIDAAFIGDMGREVVSQLEQEGYIVSPLELDRKGPEELLVLVGYIINEAWLHRQEIEHAITISTSLYTLFHPVVSICQSIIRSRKKLDPTETACKITIQIDNASMIIETQSFPENDAALLLAQRFTELHPAIAQGASTKSKVQVKSKLPNRTSKRRRGQL